jgi:hypothetical protein
MYIKKCAYVAVLAACLSLILFYSCLSAVELDALVSKQYIRRIHEIETMRCIGKIEMGGMEGTMEIRFYTPDRIYMFSDFGFMEFSQAFDGDIAWLKDQNEQVMELSGIEKRSLVNAAYLTGMSYLMNDRMTGTVEYIRDTAIDGRDYSIFSALPTNGDSLFLFFRKENQRVEISCERLDEIIIYTYMSDFRSIGGVELPFLYQSQASVPEYNSSIELTGIEINIPLETSVFSMPVVEVRDFAYPNDLDSVIIPVQYYNGHIFVNVSVNGEKDVYFILDTGAGSNILDSSYAAKLGLQWSGELPAKGIAGYEPVAFTRIDSLKIDRIKLTDNLVAIVDLRGLSLRLPGEFGGLIGYDLLSRLPFKINYMAEELTFYNPARFNPPDSEYALDFDFIMKVPLVRVEYNSYPARFLVDFGNPFGLMLHRSFVEKYNLKESFSDIKKMGSRIGGVGGKSEAYAATGTNLRIGPAEINNPPLMVIEADKGVSESSTVDGNIGNLLLQKFSILMDYGRKYIYILPLKE